MTRRDITKLFKRFFITFFCCVPIFLIVGFLLENKIQSYILTIIFVVIGGAIFAMEELIYFKAKQKREKLKDELKSQDYFKEKSKTTDNNSKKSNKSTNKKVDK